jgi:hypothetical protein
MKLYFIELKRRHVFHCVYNSRGVFSVFYQSVHLYRVNQDLDLGKELFDHDASVTVGPMTFLFRNRYRDRVTGKPDTGTKY